MSNKDFEKKETPIKNSSVETNEEFDGEEFDGFVYDVDWAIRIIEQAVNLGQSGGCYTLNDSVLIAKAVELIKMNVRRD